jgi:pyruvate dehydrogenase E2 component (dihydrolipoamide acetyltransferase)
VATIPSTASGVVSKIYVKVGDKISVGQRVLSVSGDAKADGPAKARPAAAGAPKTKVPAPGPEPPSEPEAESESKVSPAASPAIRKLTRELGLDLNRVRGTARGGRITMDDLRAYLQRLQNTALTHAAASPAPAKPAAEQIDFSRWGPVNRKPFTPLRQVIARRMSESWSTIPHVTQFDEADVTGLLALRKKYADAYEKKGARLTLTSFVLKAVADTLKRHPLFNSSLDEAAQEIVFKDYIHLGVAVDTDAGLMVPVIRDVDKKDLVQLSKDLELLAAKARDRKIAAEELKGSTFTISNQGGIGGGHFTPIINKPDVAILGLGKGKLKAVAPDNTLDRLQSRMMLPLALSYDHRVADGANAARFIVDLVKTIENFDESTVKL